MQTNAVSYYNYNLYIYVYVMNELIKYAVISIKQYGTT